MFGRAVSLALGLAIASAVSWAAHAQNPYPDIAGMVNRDRGWQSKVPQIPDYAGCYNRGEPWVMDEASGQCIQLSPEQLQQNHDTQEAEKQSVLSRQRALANDPRGDADIKSFCATASQMSCSLFKGDVYDCESRVSRAANYLASIRYAVDVYKITPQQAINMMHLQDPWLAHDAADAPASLSPGWFRIQELHDCLDAVIARN